MTNSRAVCLVLVVLFCSDVTLARQLPKECSKGPDYWCKTLKQASDCGAVGHCTSTVWETKQDVVSNNEISDKFVKLFRQLKDVKDLINEDYLASRVASACTEIQAPIASKICRENTAHLEQYLSHVLGSAASPETMCRVIGMCNNEKLDNVVALNKKKLAGNDKHKDIILGAEKCVWGPSYWCSNITTSHSCKATHHCVERVWSKMQVPEDNDSICKICTDMVKQARDQLTSNETQEQLKEVFEGSCNLIPIKLVREECDKLADQFVPDLVETLASQMNPQIVCSVAGLCNNAKIDRMLEDYNVELKKRTDCNNCHQTVGVLRKRFDATSYDDFLVGLLQYCRGMGSFSDSCSMLVFKYYENILEGVRHDLKPDGVCHVSGMCGHMFHSHSDYVFPTEVTEVKATDDVPCEFCEQLVTHLRDVLVANTTGVEFYKILKGLCRQTGSFSKECLSLAEQYYPIVYNYLISDMKPKEICGLLGICPNSDDFSVAPLVPKELAIKVLGNKKLIGEDEKNSERVAVKLAAKQTNVRIIGQEALPIERMFVSLPESKTACSFCEYFLHYLQVELSDLKTEEEIKAAVEKACDHLPKSVEPQCKAFVTEYGPAVIALLVQEIDPASVCPALGMCPQQAAVRRVAINEDKSNCPLCLFAVEQLETMLKNNRTETSIKAALESLCSHLSQKLRSECTDFVDAYSSQLVEMLIADMDAQEICVYLKLCTDTSRRTDPLQLSPSSTSVDKFFDSPRLQADRNQVRKTPQPKYTLDAAGDIETNMIPDHTVNGRPFVATQNSACVICEFVLKEIDDQIKDKHNDDEIKKIVLGVCKHMPKSVKPDCNQFVEKYADLVISLLAQELNPDEVCRELKLCSGQALRDVKEAVLDCAVCETVVMAVKKVLGNDKADHDIVHVVEKACALLPAKYNDRCHTMLEIYGASVIHLIEEIGTKGVCQKIGLCAARAGHRLRMIRNMNKN